jgi:hypothetical protein
MKVKALHNVIHDGVFYSPGSIVEVSKDDLDAHPGAFSTDVSALAAEVKVPAQKKGKIAAPPETPPAE